MCDHSKKFVFLSGTTVKPIALANIPPRKFYFKDFVDILSGNCKSVGLKVNFRICLFIYLAFFINRLILHHIQLFLVYILFISYLIGVAHEINNIQEKTSGKKVVVSLKLRDLK